MGIFYCVTIMVYVPTLLLELSRACQYLYVTENRLEVGSFIHRRIRAEAVIKILLLKERDVKAAHFRKK